MNIRLKNIGIVSDSTIEVKGLTVITGHNNSGKTTVGKVLYSLIDAVSNLEEKAATDKYNYLLDQIYDAKKEFSFYSYLDRKIDEVENEYIKAFFSDNCKPYIERDGVEKFLTGLIDQIYSFSIYEEPYKSIIEQSPAWILFKKKIDEKEFSAQKEKSILLLTETYEELMKDPELIDYAKQSVSATLSLEFSGQIQPVAEKNIFSQIDMIDGDTNCFSIELYDNEIVNSEAPIFNWMPYKNTYFIDNPFIIGEPLITRFYRNFGPKNTFPIETHILKHEDKLKRVVNSTSSKSVFESGIIEEKYTKIKEKIDNILPGDFVSSREGQYYVHNGVKLKASNLATGSKMFSIIKLLLSKGEITEKTLLILDEPEAHLHPKWQNLFAEIMIVLVKEVGCHILLTTHSPNFMLALEANMRKYEAMDLCNFYQTEHLNDSMFVNYKCVNDSLEDIYADFVKYLSDMKILRNSY